MKRAGGIGRGVISGSDAELVQWLMGGWSSSSVRDCQQIRGRVTLIVAVSEESGAVAAHTFWWLQEASGIVESCNSKVKMENLQFFGLK